MEKAFLAAEETQRRVSEPFVQNDLHGQGRSTVEKRGFQSSFELDTEGGGRGGCCSSHKMRTTGSVLLGPVPWPRPPPPPANHNILRQLKFLCHFQGKPHEEGMLSC